MLMSTLVTVVNQFSNLPRPASRQRASWRRIKIGLEMLAKIIWKAGVSSNYRREFCKICDSAIARRQNRDRHPRRRGVPSSDPLRA
jgi:hypothetical protein